MDFLVSRAGQRQGPYTQEDVRQGLEEGWLTPEDLIWYEDLPEWRRIDEVFVLEPGPPDPAYPAATAPVAPFAAEPASALPARTQVIKRIPSAAKTQSPRAPHASEASIASSHSQSGRRKKRAPRSKRRWILPLVLVLAAGLLAGLAVAFGIGS